MSTYRIFAAAAIAAALVAGPAAAQQGQQQGQAQPQAQQQQQAAANLDELLEAVQAGALADNREHRERLARFQREQAEQNRLLQEAREQKAAEEQRSQELDTLFQENELLVADVRQQLEERLGSLRELFGVLQQVSGNARSQFQASLTNIEYPERIQFLSDLAAKMGSTTTLPSISEIERLWFELQREATELGKVKRLNDFRVVTADGEERFEDIARVGAFNLVADGRYLQHNGETNSVSELQRQPSEGRFTSSTSDLLEAQPDDGLVRFGIDMTRGQLLSLLIETPDFPMGYIRQGGEVGYVIIALGVLGILLALERLITLGIAGRKVSSQLRRETPSGDNPLGRVLMVYESNKNVDTETLELKLGEAILKEQGPLQRGILFIKVISVVAPLLGLLGTVVGMIQTFQAITLYGTGDPTIMASGISVALMTTVLGLCVAIPTVLLHTMVAGRSRRIMQVLQEQSAGIIARQAEKTH